MYVISGNERGIVALILTSDVGVATCFLQYRPGDCIS